jgi:hypothetical protein
MKNYYPEKQLMPYVKTSVEMGKVILYLQKVNAPIEVKRMTYVVFRNESANGRSGICNNYCGFQADSGRWDAKYDLSIYGVVRKVENGTGKERFFLAFKDFSDCLNMLIDKMEARGLYIGGTTYKIWKHTITDASELSRAYKKEWVSGSVNAEPSADELKNFVSMYNQAKDLFK